MAEPVDAKAFYGYLFLPDKKPSKVLDAFLRGIAKYIIESLGDTNIHSLTPFKLAAFYKAVGGNYDSLFLETPHSIISIIYQSIGCQHCLLPTSNSFAAPSIPALTTPGFVRWEALQILLEPDEHVPFIQSALRNFSIKHPDTGESFPVEIPREAFPLHTDVQIEKWHKQCAEKLLQDGSPDGNESSGSTTFFSRPRGKSEYSHPRASFSRESKERQFADYYASKIRTSSKSSARATTRPPLSNQSSRRSRRASDADEVLENPRGRRMSAPNNIYVRSPHISPAQPVPQAGLRPPVDTRTRRHSHPRTRVRPNSSSSGSDTDTQPTSDASLSPAPSPRRRFQVPNGDGKRTSFSAPSPTSPLNPPLSTRHRGRSAPQIFPDPRLDTQQIPVPVSSAVPTPTVQNARLSARFENDLRNNMRWQAGFDDSNDKYLGKSTSDWEHERLRRSSQDNYVHSKLGQPRSGSHDSRTRNRFRTSRDPAEEEDLDSERRPRRFYGEIRV